MVKGIDRFEALEVLKAEGNALAGVLSRADAVRREHRGNRVALCAILNARSGACPEDCAFCAQSVHAQAEIERYPLLDPESMVKAARRARGWGVGRFSIVTSGSGVGKETGLGAIAHAVRGIRTGVGVLPCASLGTVGAEELARRLRLGVPSVFGRI